MGSSGVNGGLTTVLDVAGVFDTGDLLNGDGEVADDLRRPSAARQEPTHAEARVMARYDELTQFNALRHGVLSRYTVLPWENADEYRTLLAALVAEHSPLGPTEEHLVEELAGILWRKRRLRLAENAWQDALRDTVTPTGGVSEHRPDEDGRCRLRSGTLGAISQYNAHCVAV